MYELRPYQQEAVDRAVNFFRSDKKGNAILVLPTGAGKSLVVANIAKQLDAPTIVLQPSKEILEQNYTKLCSYGTRGAGIFSASLNRREVAPITFATIGSVKRYTKSFSVFKYIIIDECHCVNAEDGMYKEFIDALGCKVLGLTATPYRLCSYREYGSILKFITRTKKRIFNEVLYVVQVRELLHQGFLAQLKYYRLNIVDTRQLTLNSTGADFTDQSVRRHYDAIDFRRHLTDIVRRLLVAGRESILVFTRFVEEAEHITQMFPDCSAVVSGTTSKGEREDILQRFKSGRIKVVANVGVLTTGFDFPALSTVVLARPTMSLALYYQMVGRAIRPYPGKDAWIVDLCGNYDRFGKVEDLELREPKKGMWAVYSGDKQLTNVFFGDAYGNGNKK